MLISPVEVAASPHLDKASDQPWLFLKGSMSPAALAAMALWGSRAVGAACCSVLFCAVLYLYEGREHTTSGREGGVVVCMRACVRAYVRVQTVHEGGRVRPGEVHTPMQAAAWAGRHDSGRTCRPGLNHKRLTLPSASATTSASGRDIQ
jgi:hypothetical protein